MNLICLGSLRGVFNDDKPFEKIRLIDRFEVVDFKVSTKIDVFH